MTMNSPQSLSELHSMVSPGGNTALGIKNAELMREVGLKCIGFNGVSCVQVMVPKGLVAD
jgi:hypothetical protein